MADLQLLLEAERRGLLPADKQALLTEARSRGLVEAPTIIESTLKPIEVAPATMAEKVVGSPVGRFALGAAELPVGVGRFGENVAMAAGVPGIGGVGQTWDKLQAMKTKGMNAPTELSSYDPLGIVARAGKEMLYKGGEAIGLDPRSWDIMGGMGSTVAAGGILNKLAPAATFGKQVLQSAGVNAGLGLVNPNAKDLGSNVENAALGAALGTIIPVSTVAAAKALGWGYDIATGKLFQKQAGKILREIAGEDVNALAAAGRAAAPELTGAQAAAGIHNTQLQALGQVAKDKNTANFFSKKAELATEDAQTVLDSLASGTTQVESNLARKAAKQALNLKTTPMREAELAAAAPSIDTSTITSSIDTKLIDPAIGVSDINRRVLTAVKRKIEEWTAKNGGVIDPVALYGVRKNTVNEVIDRLINKADPKASAKYGAKLLAEVNPMIDDAIEAAGGKGWRQYLATHSEGLKDIERQEMASVLSELYRNKSYDKFQKIVTGGDAKTVANIFGPGNEDIKELMGTRMVPLNKIAADLKRTDVMLDRAKQGAVGLQDILSKDATKLRLPALFSRVATISNMVLDNLQFKVNRATFAALEKGMQSGKNMAELIEALPASQRNDALRALADPKVARQITMQTSRNALAPNEQQNQNALAQ
jgi:hypothetical protein